MRISFKCGNNHLFKYRPINEGFIYIGDAYMKLDEIVFEDRKVNAVNLISGTLTWFDDDEEVTPVDSIEVYY